MFISTDKYSHVLYAKLPTAHLQSMGSPVKLMVYYPLTLPPSALPPRSPDGRLLCSGDDFGRVRLFHYPVVVEHAPSVAATGHSSHVMNVRFSGDGKRVWSVGGHDSAVFQWRLVTGQAAAATPTKVSSRELHKGPI
jgi:WD40 repeat protein